MRIVVSSVTWCVLAIAGSVSNVRAQTDDDVAVRQVVEAIAAFSQAKNLEGLDSLYAPGRSVHIIEGAGVNHGWVDYRDHHLKPELDELGNFTYR